MINMFREMPAKVGNQKSTVFLVYFADGGENKDSKSFEWQNIKRMSCVCVRTVYGGKRKLNEILFLLYSHRIRSFFHSTILLVCQ